jgi:copper chaperone CopZ
MGEIAVSVPGVKCGGCVAERAYIFQSCELALKTVPGFVEAAFDIPAKTAVIRGDVDVPAAIAALSKAGYPATLKTP